MLKKLKNAEKVKTGTDRRTDQPTEPVVEFNVFALGVRILDQTAMALS